MFKWIANTIVVFWLALAGAMSDAIDGWLAKRFGWGTRFGELLDQYVDWFFGFMLLYAIYEGHGGTLAVYTPPFNAVLLVLIVSYLLVRLKFPTVETTRTAKIKTALQFGGAASILGGLAYQYEFFVNIGYVTVWISVGYMWESYRRYNITSRK